MSAPRPPRVPTERLAEVRAGDRVTRYRGDGAGRVVLVLHADGAAEPLWPELLPALVRGSRVLTPELSEDAAEVAGHLLAFLEGLGAADVRVVATEPFCTAALELALRDEGRVSRVVLVSGRASDGCGVAGGVTTDVRDAAVPLLVVGRAAPATDAVACVARFVHGDD